MAERRALILEIVTPAERGSRSGNRVTALRWAKRARELGHRVSVTNDFGGGAPDCLIALHAVKSVRAIERCHERSPHTAIVVALTGTDVYGDLEHSEVALRSLELSTAIVTLQPLAAEKLPVALRAKSRVIHQSAPPA